MVRPVSAALATELAKAAGASFRVLLDLTPPGGATVRLAGEDLTISGTPYTGELLSVGHLDYRLSGSTDLQVSVLDNAANRAAARLGGAAVLRLWAVGIALSEADVVLEGTVSDPISRRGGAIHFDVLSLAERHDRLIGRPLSQDDFAGAVTPDIGRVLPNVLGSVDRSECVPVDAGAVSRLSVEVDDAVTAFDLDDASAFPSSGTIQIDEEQITYTGKTGNQLTGGTRAQNGTAAASHLLSADVGEVQSAYTYLIADHAIRTVDEVYVEEVRQLGVTSTLNGAIDAVVTSIAITDATLFPAKGSIKVDSEWIHYTAKSANTLTGCTRGRNGTVAASHSDAAAVEAVEWQVDIQAAGAELVTNGAFASDTGWTKGDGWSIAAGVAACDGTQVAASDLEQDVQLDAGRQYLVTFTISGYVAGTLTPVLAGQAGTARSANGTYTELLMAGTGTSPRLELRADADFNGNVDDVSASAPRALLTFFAHMLLKRLESIEVIDTIDIDDPTHSHEGASGTMTGAPGTVSLTGNPTLIRNPSNINASTANYASQQYQDSQTNSVGTIAFTLSQSTTGKTPVSATLQVKAAESFGSHHLNFGGGKWVWNHPSFFVSQANLEAGQFVTRSATASITSWSQLQSLATTLIGPAILSVGDTRDVFRVYSVEITSITYQEEGLQNAFTGISKIGTVTLDGQTTGSLVIGRSVQVDVQGLVDDDLGSITATARTLIERPDHIARAALRHFGGATPAHVAAAGFDAFSGEALALRLDSQLRVQELLGRLRLQAQAIIGFSGSRWYMSKRPADQAAISSPDFVLADAQIVRGEDGASSLAVSVVGLREIANRLHWRAGERWDGGWEHSGREEDAASQDSYGVREMAVDFRDQFDQADADAVAAWMLSRLAVPTRAVLSLLTTLAQYTAEIGDTVSVTSTKLGGVSAVKGEVTAVRVMLSGGEAGLVEITIEEAAP